MSTEPSTANFRDVRKTIISLFSLLTHAHIIKIRYLFQGFILPTTLLMINTGKYSLSIRSKQLNATHLLLFLIHEIELLIFALRKYFLRYL